MKKIKATVVLWFLRLFDYKLSSRAKRIVLVGLLVVVKLIKNVMISVQEEFP